MFIPTLRHHSGLRIAIVMLVLVWSSGSSGTVTTWVEGVKIDWSEGVLEATGVGRADFSSSIARPSKHALFEAAAEDAKRKILACTKTLWIRTPLFSNRLGDARAIVEQVLVAHPPRMTLFSDGTVHAFIQLPLSSLEPSLREDLMGDGEPLVIRVSADYKPTLGILFCLAGETRSIAQSRVTLHDTYTELPTFLQTNTVTNISATYDSVFQCLSLEDLPQTHEAWLELQNGPRVYVVRLTEKNAL